MQYTSMRFLQSILVHVVRECGNYKNGRLIRLFVFNNTRATYTVWSPKRPMNQKAL